VTAPASPDPDPAERAAITAVAHARDQCLCGGRHDDRDPLTAGHKARISAYLANHPGHQFAYDDTEDGTVFAVIIPPPEGHGPPAVIAAAPGLPALLDAISAPPAPPSHDTSEQTTLDEYHRQGDTPRTEGHPHDRRHRPAPPRRTTAPHAPAAAHRPRGPQTTGSGPGPGTGRRTRTPRRAAGTTQA
jgi:hypothetical protein